MSEIEYAPVEVIQGDEQRSWEERKQAFMDRLINVLDYHFENAREVAEVKVVYGQNAIEKFAKEVGISRSSAYNYRNVWKKWGDDWLNGTLPPNLYWTQFLDSVRRVPEGKQKQSIEDASTEGRSEPEHDRATQGADQPNNVQLITHFVCPECGALSPMSAVETRER